MLPRYLSRELNFAPLLLRLRDFFPIREKFSQTCIREGVADQLFEDLKGDGRHVRSGESGVLIAHRPQMNDDASPPLSHSSQPSGTPLDGDSGVLAPERGGGGDDDLRAAIGGGGGGGGGTTPGACDRGVVAFGVSASRSTTISCDESSA